jgi:O-antigen/teichoic acid export membrane protein
VAPPPESEVAVSVNSAPPASIRRRAISGALVTLGGFGMSNALRLGSNLILSRLLNPETFGLMAIVSLFLQGLSMFSDFGITPAIVQSKRGTDPEFLNTAWTIGVIRGVALFACMCILAYPVGRFYEHPVLYWILPAVGLNAIITGFRSTAVATQSRDLVLGRQTVIDLVSQLVTIIVMVTWAWFDRSVWALVVGGNVGAVVSVVLSHVALPGIKHRLLWDRAMAKELLGFGKWITFSTAFSFLAAQGDRGILSTFVSLSMVGVYSTATNIAQVPGNVLNRLQSAILFPVYSRWGRGDRKELAEKVYKVRLKTLAAFLAPPCVIAIVAEPAIRLLYDSRYHEAGWMLALMCIALVIHTLTTTIDPILLATGDSFAHMRLTITKGAVVFIAMLVGGYIAGVKGLLLGTIVGRTLQYPLLVLELRGKGLWMPWLDLGAAVAAGAVIFVGRALVALLPF